MALNLPLPGPPGFRALRGLRIVHRDSCGNSVDVIENRCGPNRGIDEIRELQRRRRAIVRRGTDSKFTS